MKQKLIEINNNTGFRVIFSPRGASIYAIYFDDKIMTLTPKNHDDFLKSNIYYGKMIGPIANRIEGGNLCVGSIKVKIPINEGNNTLHSGPLAISDMDFSYRIFDLVDDIKGIEFKLETENLPSLEGKINYTFVYLIDFKHNEIKLIIDAICNEDSVLSLTNHSYFCLGSKSLDDLSLSIKSKSYIKPRKEDLIYLYEEALPSYLSFNKKKAIMKDINHPSLLDGKYLGYDHCYVIDDKKPIVLSNNKYKLTINSTMPCVQIYSDNYVDGIEVLNTVNKTHRALAIEPMLHPLKLKITPKNEHYFHTITYKFEKVS